MDIKNKLRGLCGDLRELLRQPVGGAPTAASALLASLESSPELTTEERAVRAHLRSWHDRSPLPLVPDAYNGWYLGTSEAAQLLEGLRQHWDIGGSTEVMWSRFVDASRTRDARDHPSAPDVPAPLDERLVIGTSSLVRAVDYVKTYRSGLNHGISSPRAIANSKRLSGLGLTAFSVALRRSPGPSPSILHDLATVRGALIGARRVVDLFREFETARADQLDDDRFRAYVSDRVAQFLAGNGRQHDLG